MSEWFAVVDCARDARLYSLVEKCSETACLYSGEYDDETRTALPYLVKITQDEPLAETWRQYEGGKFWGILCNTQRDFAALRRHFRKFTTARLPDGEIVMFRFWDPRVFDTFAKSATPEEIAPLFEDISSFVGDPGGGRRSYQWNEGILINGQPFTAAA
ncbi:MAG: DUF4123 domain-containing protein [Pseudomonadota bacterium]